VPLTKTQTSAETVTILTNRDPELVHAGLWRSIVNAWPSWSAPPIASIVRPEDVLDSEIPKSIVLIEDAVGINRATLQLIDHARADMVPVVVLCDTKERSKALEDGAEVMTIDGTSSPALIAHTLATLTNRQPIVNALREEVRVLHRFHTGVRGEIEKINEEMQLAATVQREFLPAELPTAEGFEFSALFRPCGSVSGDIYDIRRIDDRYICLLIADAVGHGVPAALMTMVIAKSVVHTINQLTLGSGVDPAIVLSELNKDLSGRGLESPRFATAVCGVLDTQTNEVCLASAGHPHPLIIRMDGEIERAPCEGCLLGVFDDADYESCNVSIEPGDVLIVYSDGFEVAFPSAKAHPSGSTVPNTHYLDQFARIPQNTHDSNLSEALFTLASELDAHQGSLHQQDDLTIVGVARKP